MGELARYVLVHAAKHAFYGGGGAMRANYKHTRETTHLVDHSGNSGFRHSESLFAGSAFPLVSAELDPSTLGTRESERAKGEEGRQGKA